MYEYNSRQYKLLTLQYFMAKIIYFQSNNRIDMCETIIDA